MSKRNRKSSQPTKPIPTLHNAGLVTIIIPVLNRFDVLKECLDAIPDAFGEIPYDIVIVDNGSNKKEADEFYLTVKNATIFRGKDNAGFPAACNFGAGRTRSPLLFFLNSDVVMHKDSGVKLVRAMDDPQVGVVGMRLIFPTELKEGMNPKWRDPGKIQHIGISVDINGNAYHAFLGWDADHPRVMSQSEVFAVTGAAIMTRRSIWNQLGGFREEYGLGTWEDIDLCVSARTLGYNIKVIPQASGIHYTGSSAEINKISYDLQGNRLIFLQRHRDKMIWWDGLML